MNRVLMLASGSILVALVVLNFRQGANFPSIKRPTSWTVQSDWPLKKDAMRLHLVT
jgi:hypothetical protein